MSGAAVNLKPERLRNVTRNLLSLQSGGGITVAAFGLFFFAMDVDHVLPKPFADSLTVLAGVLCFFAYRYMPKYYERRFGHVEARDTSISARGFLILLSVLVVLAIIGPQIGRRADVFANHVDDWLHILISDRDRRVDFAPILFWSFLLLIGGGSSWRNPNKNKGLMLVTIFVALCWTIFFFYPLHHPAIAKLLVWRIVSAGWLGITLIALGLYEHFSVILLLPKRSLSELPYD